MIRPALLVGLGAAVVATAFALNYALVDRDEAAVSADRGPPASPATQTQPRPRVPSGKASGRPAGVAPETSPAAPKTAAGAPSPAKPGTITAPPSEPGAAPSFDVVRINRSGDTVMAGRAKPGSRILIFDTGKLIGEAKADSRGEWVFVPSRPLPVGNRQLSLEAVDKDGVKVSSEPLLLVVPERGKDIAGRPTKEKSQPLALKLSRKGGKVREVLQKPRTPKAPTRLLVDAVDYDAAGRLDIVGHAPAGAVINLYLDNRFIGRARADGRGIWRAAPKGVVEPGIYRLRADQVAEAGAVASRIEIVFARKVPLTGVRPGTLVVVEEGNSLWRIARRTYGTGFRYTVIYEANKAQIRNANLIYPGQVFTLPTVN